MEGLHRSRRLEWKTLTKDRQIIHTGKPGRPKKVEILGAKGGQINADTKVLGVGPSREGKIETLDKNAPVEDTEVPVEVHNDPAEFQKIKENNE